MGGWIIRAMTPGFWKTKQLAEMTPDEWDALCDRCGLCCLEKYEDQESGDIFFTSQSCPFLNNDDCSCLIYADRHRLNPQCVELSADLLPQLIWLPESCAYRLIASGYDLPSWHHLVCGDPNEVHNVENAVHPKTVVDVEADLLRQKPAALFRISKYRA